MTNHDYPSIDLKQIEINRLRERLEQARDDCWRMAKSNDKLRQELVVREDLLGPDFRYPYLRSDGVVCAVPATRAREETIRWFAGQALSGIEIGLTATPEVIALRARTIALALWADLEDWFQIERQARKAVQAEAQNEADAKPEARDGDDVTNR